jgi:hypothetical protein
MFGMRFWGRPIEGHFQALSYVKVHSHLVLGTLVLCPFNTILVIQDLNLLNMKILC